jgi:hypothetical protein
VSGEGVYGVEEGGAEVWVEVVCAPAPAAHSTHEAARPM